MILASLRIGGSWVEMMKSNSSMNGGFTELVLLNEISTLIACA